MLQEITNIHFIGIGGIGMSALARLFLHEGRKITGSDREATDITRTLQKEGIIVFDTQKKENIPSDVELVVYTEAMSEDHEEMMAARKLGVPMLSYFEALGHVANEYYLIAVAGTHGKTTTAAMLTDILEKEGLDPTAIIGSLRSKTGSNFKAGKSKYAIVEACEYKRNFLSLTPDVLVITNIEAEHLDYYKDLGDVQSAFRELCSQIREGGFVVANTKDSNVKPVLDGVDVTVVNYCDYFDPLLKLSQPGMHNQMNAAAASAAAAQIGIDQEVAKRALENFKGTWRRFEYKGEVHLPDGKASGAKVYDDYGHHPTEIAATLQGVRELYPDKKITLVYQPHLGSRTEKLFGDFVEALRTADHIILTPIYRARAESTLNVSSEALAETIRKNHSHTEHLETFEEIAATIKKNVNENDIVLVMGAGDITKVTTMLI